MGYADVGGQARIEVTIVWLVGLIACLLGFLLAIVSLTLPWTLVYPRPGERVPAGGPEEPFLTRISNYEPASIVTVLLVIGLALLVTACFGTVGLLNRVLRVVTPAAGVFCAWFVGILYILVLSTIKYGYSREFGQPARLDRTVYSTAPSTGLSLYCLGVLMMAVGSAFAIRPAANRQPVAVAQPGRFAYVCAGIALVMLIGSFSEPWLRQPADPMAVDASWGGPPQLESWLVVFRFTTIAALICLTVLLRSKSAQVRRLMTGAGLVTCAVTVAILLTGRMIVWLPVVQVDIRPTYYLAIGAAVLLEVTFLASALRDVVGRQRADTPDRSHDDAEEDRDPEAETSTQGDGQDQGIGQDPDH